MKIKLAKAYSFLDSKARRTIGIKVQIRNNTTFGLAESGTSTGAHEAQAYAKNLDYSIAFFNTHLKDKFQNIEINTFNDLQKIEALVNKIDSNNEQLGANPTIALEYAILQALSKEVNKPIWQIINKKAHKMPQLLANVVGGGAHAGESASSVQENLILVDNIDFKNSVEITRLLYNSVRDILSKKDKLFLGGKSDEGAYLTHLSALQTLSILKQLCQHFEQKLGNKIILGADFAATSFYNKEKQVYEWKNLKPHSKITKRNAQEQIRLIKFLVHEFDLGYLEDPFQEEDFESFSILRHDLKTLYNKTPLICGDDLTCTNPQLLKKTISLNSINSIIIKPNQIGSLIRTKQVVDLANKNNIIPILSHRSGSTEDTTLSHLAVGWQIPIVKFGIAGGERSAKLNELLKIEREIKGL